MDPAATIASGTEGSAVVMFTDLEGSVALKTRLGEASYTEHLRLHDAAFRAVLEATPGGELRKDLGDGFLATFQTPAQGVRAALAFQQALVDADWPIEPLKVRVGLHEGPITELGELDEGHGKLVGLTADVAARIMGLALPGQVLLSRSVFDGARESVSDAPGESDAELRWMAHGPYLFQGADKPLEVYEVGVNGVAPLRAPPDGGKARRAVPAGEEELYGWRPAAGLPVPGQLEYVLERRLGEGGFGEVWLARHADDKTPLVFKFCFDAERVRGLRRELAIFKFAQEALGDRDDIARVKDIRIEQPPFWLESEFTEHGDLAEWSTTQGGIDGVSLEERLRLLAEIADAVAAAHSVGILHKDLKPSNVLVWQDESGRPRPRLADFGIGMLTDLDQLVRHDITVVGFTEMASEASTSSMSGTRLYAPPETLAGKPFTTGGDVYALGVMLYQLAVGDLTRPIGHGWESDVTDPLLREDIAACVARRPDDRLGSAGELAERLRSLDARRAERQAAAAEEALAARRKRRNKLLAVGSGVLVLLLAGAAFLFLQERRLRDLADKERERAVEALETADAVTSFLNDDLLGSVDPRESKGRDITVREVLDKAAADVGTRFEERPAVEASLRRTLGRVYLGLALFGDARLHLERARELYEALEGEDSLALAKTLEHLALLESVSNGDKNRAVALARRVMEVRRKVLGSDDPLTLRAEADVGMYEALQAGKLAAGIDNPMMLNMLANVRQLGETPEEMRQELIRLIYEAERLWKQDDKEGVRQLAERVARPFLDNKAFAERVPWAWAAMARSLQADERTHASRAICWAAIAVGEPRWGEAHPQVLFAIQTMAIILSEQEAWEEALPWCERNLRLQRQTLDAEHVRVVDAQEGLAVALWKLERYEEAAKEAKAAYDVRLKKEGAEDDDTRWTAGLLASVYQAWGKADEAASWRKRAGG
ncbi:MAG: tetratricopeptide repeat protein [Planctomycetota bacterium]|nr:tetratricopeptide repeat protein [Planctomycetota bacterium]